MTTTPGADDGIIAEVGWSLDAAAMTRSAVSACRGGARGDSVNVGGGEADNDGDDDDDDVVDVVVAAATTTNGDEQLEAKAEST